MWVGLVMDEGFEKFDFSADMYQYSFPIDDTQKKSEMKSCHIGKTMSKFFIQKCKHFKIL